MAIITKSAGSVAGNLVLALQSVAASSVVKSATIDVASRFGAFLAIHFGRRATASGTAGVNIRVEGSSEASDPGFWVPLAIFTTDFQLCEAEAATGTNNAGQPVVQVASTVNLAAGDIVFIDNTANILNSEWGRIKSIVAATSVTLEDNLINAQNAGQATIYDRAEMYGCQLDLTPYLRLRVVVDGSLFTQAFAIRVRLSGGDAIA